MKILCIRFSALGDVAMLAPVVREYALSHPTDEITVLSKPLCAPMFEEIAPNVSFLGRDIKKNYKGVFGLYRLFSELHSIHFDYVCDMHDVLRTKILRFYFNLHGYKVRRINKHRELRKLITAPEPKKVLKQLPTAFENYAEVLPNFKLSTDFKLSTLNSSLNIGIAPFAAHHGKIYPIEKMERVIELLVEKEYTIYLFGAKNKEKEQNIMKGWAEKYYNVQIASDTCHNLKEELQLMKTLKVMISMDSANMHLASFVGTRVISIWGATHPYAGFLGWGQSIEKCIQVDMPCRPCSIYGKKPCIRKDMACMNNITPEMIISCIEQD